MSTIKQKEVLVETLEGRKVTVRRMRWKDAARFLRMFAAAFKLLYADNKLDSVKLSENGIAIGDGKAKGFVEIVEELAGSVDDLATHLAFSSTDLKREEFEQLDYVSGLDVLAAAIAINFDAELKKSLAGIGTAAKALVPAAKEEKTS